MKVTAKYVLRLTFLLLICCSYNFSIQLNLNIPKIVETYGKAVVLIFSESKVKDHIHIGSGFIVDNKGIIITNYHIVKGAKRLFVKLLNGDIYRVISIIGKDERRDIAIIKIDGKNFPTIKLGNSDSIRIGEPIVVIGNPKGLENTVTDGLISGIRKIEDVLFLHQISAPISSGSSGSPVFNLKGEVIGIATSSIIEGQNLNFSVPINYAKNMITNINVVSEKLPTKAFPDPANKIPLQKISNLQQFIAEMNNVIERIYFAYDNFRMSLATAEILIKLGQHFTPPEIYVAKEAINMASDALLHLRFHDKNAIEIINSYTKLIDNVTDGLELVIQAWRSNPFSNDLFAEGATKTITAYDHYGRQANQILLTLIRNNYPEMEKSLLPVVSLSDKYVYIFDKLGILIKTSISWVEVIYVYPGSRAESAQLHQGDIILGIDNGEAFPTIKEFNHYLSQIKPGKITILLIQRNYNKKLVKVVF